MQYEAIIVGGGPGGSSAASKLAEAGLRVLVLEAKKMPREKLCGEFIAPECFPTLERLGVMGRILAAGAQRITALTLTASSGRQIAASIDDISHHSGFALSLTRARFDQILFDRAREAGASCIEGFAVKGCLWQAGLPNGVEATSLIDGRTHTFRAGVVIDASGRNSRLTLGREERTGGRPGSRLYAFEAHLHGVEPVREQVELYFFRQGYGGLSRVEGGKINLCFIVDENTVKRARGDSAQILNRSVVQNPLARERLAYAEATGKWHTAGPLTFGRRRLSRDGVICVGDASGMIDPFTGTGIQIALRTGEMAAQAVIEAFGGEVVGSGTDAYAGRQNSPTIAADLERLSPMDSNRALVLQRALDSYRRLYDQEFGRRMTASGILRRAAFSPVVANALGIMLARAPWLARRILRTTRSGNGTDGS